MVRQLATQFFSLHDHLEGLPTHPLPLKTPEVPKKEVTLPYPGESAVFFSVRDSWNQPLKVESDVPCKFLEFKSSSKTSLLEAFCLYGFADGTIGMRVICKTNKCLDYLMSHGIPCDEYDWRFETSNVDLIKALFHIISENNTIDP